MRKVALRRHARLPEGYDSSRILATTVDAWGRGIWLICPHAELVPSSLGGPWLRPRDRHPFDAQLVVDDRGTVEEHTLHGVGLWPSRVDALPNGRFIVQGAAPAPARDAVSMAQIFGRDGRRRQSFETGRAAHFLMADRRNHVWSAYADEGVHADPLSCAGLVRWDSGGRREWEYAAPEGVEYIDTVYALNVDDGVAWASYYPSFPVLEARTNGQMRVRTSPVTAARGLAVHGRAIVMLGGNRQHDRLHLCRMTDHEVVVVEEAQLTRPGGAPLKPCRVPVGRGRHLYVRDASAKQWFALSIQPRGDGTWA